MLSELTGFLYLQSPQITVLGESKGVRLRARCTHRRARTVLRCDVELKTIVRFQTSAFRCPNPVFSRRSSCFVSADGDNRCDSRIAGRYLVKSGANVRLRPVCAVDALDRFSAHSATTSLLVRLTRVDIRELGVFTASWLNKYLFPGEVGGILQLPVSTEASQTSPAVIIHEHDSAPCGFLVFMCRPTSEDGGVDMYILSQRRLVNGTGFVSASLPGERRIVCSIFPATQAGYGSQSVVVTCKVSG